MSPPLQPIPTSRRHPADYSDEFEHAEVARILTGLPEEHPARIAYVAGARETADSISLTHLAADRPKEAPPIGIRGMTTIAEHPFGRTGGERT